MPSFSELPSVAPSIYFKNFSRPASRVAAVLILFASCSGFEKVVKSTDYELKYTEAKRYYDKGDYYRAQVLYDQIAPIYRGTAKADSIYYMQAMSYYMQKDYILGFGCKVRSLVRCLTKWIGSPLFRTTG